MAERFIASLTTGHGDTCHTAVNCDISESPARPEELE